MKIWFSWVKKEWLESLRSGKVLLMTVLFVLFGIMNPAIAKLTPWMMEMLSESLAESGMMVTEVTVDALTSWTQFFKNVPMAFLVFVIVYSSSFTKEYQSGTLSLILTKGLPRYQVIFGKVFLQGLLWTVWYYLCFGITWVYNEMFWDNAIATHLLPAVVMWWLFGLWVIGLMVLFSTISQTNTQVLLGTGGVVLAFYLLGLFPKLSAYMPTKLMNSSSLLFQGSNLGDYGFAVALAIILTILCIALSVPVMNRRRI